MKRYKIKLYIIGYQRRLRLFINNCLNIYPYTVAHEGEGCYEYLKDMFEEERPYLIKTLKRMNRAGIKPNIGDMLYGYDNIYYIMKICYYDSHCTFWVDEDNNR